MSTERILITGPKGGQYWIDESGKKHYVKKSKKDRKIEPLKMKRYTACITVYKNGEYYDDFNEWRDAYCKEGAIEKFREDYPNPKKYTITITSVRDI